MTKRLASLALGAAAAATFLMPAAPASAVGECWSWITTPVECAKQLARVCYVEGTQLKCPGLGSGS